MAAVTVPGGTAGERDGGGALSGYLGVPSCQRGAELELVPTPLRTSRAKGSKQKGNQHRQQRLVDSERTGG